MGLITPAHFCVIAAVFAGSSAGWLHKSNTPGKLTMR